MEQPILGTAPAAAVRIMYRVHEWWQHGKEEPHLEVLEYEVVKETPRGCWVLTSRILYTKRFVLNDSKKRFAHPTKEEAYRAYYHRKWRQVTILRARLKAAEAAYAQAKRLNPDWAMLLNASYVGKLQFSPVASPPPESKQKRAHSCCGTCLGHKTVGSGWCRCGTKMPCSYANDHQPIETTLPCPDCSGVHTIQHAETKTGGS